MKLMKNSNKKTKMKKKTKKDIKHKSNFVPKGYKTICANNKLWKKCDNCKKATRNIRRRKGKMLCWRCFTKTIHKMPQFALPGYHCDYEGNCNKKPYCEVYQPNWGWSYLCKGHYLKEKKRKGDDLMYWIIKKDEKKKR